MKKIISIIVALMVCSALTACNGTNSKKHRFEGLIFVNSVGDCLSNLDSFDAVERVSEFVVVGEFIDDASVCYEGYMYDGYFENDILINIISSCPMKITRVLSGDAKVGDVVNVLQREGIWKDRFVSFSHLTPMQKGDEWVFCLRRSDPESEHCEGYWCIGVKSGRYPTSNVGANETMCFSDHPELGVYEKYDFNEKIYNELVEKYGI